MRFLADQIQCTAMSREIQFEDSALKQKINPFQTQNLNNGNRKSTRKLSIILLQDGVKTVFSSAPHLCDVVLHTEKVGKQRCVCSLKISLALTGLHSPVACQKEERKKNRQMC